MKITIALLLLPMILMAGPNGASIVSPGVMGGSSLPPPPPPMAAPTFTLADPMRKIGDKVLAFRGADAADGWYEFSGTVLQVQKDGIRINGSYTDHGEVEFFLKNFPYEVAENETIGEGMTIYIAKDAGVYTYSTVMGSSRTIRCLDYGEVYVPPAPKPLTPEEVEILKKKQADEKTAAEKKKADMLAAGLKHDQELADKNDGIGLQNMGERYRDGRGVEKDLGKARDYLQRAKDAGNWLAEDDLKNLPSK